MKKTLKPIAIAIGTLSTTLLVSFSCGKGVDPDSSSSVTVSVYAAACGALDGATLTAYSLDSDGQQTTIGTGTVSDSQASLNLPSTAGPVLFEATGGTCTDMATGLSTDLSGFSLYATSASLTSNRSIAITPISSIAAAYRTSASGDSIADKISAANAAVAYTAGVNDITTVAGAFLVLPSDSSSDDAKIGVLVSGLSQYASNLGVSLADLVSALSRDFHRDGIFDGLDSGNELHIGTAGQILPWDAWTSGIPEAEKAFIASDKNPGFTTDSIPTTKASSTSEVSSGQSLPMVLTYVDGNEATGLNADTSRTASRGGDLARSMIACNGAVYVGWQEKNADETSVIRLSKYDGKTWTRLDGGSSSAGGLNIDTSANVKGISLQCFNSKLYMAQTFSSNAKDILRVQSYDGTSWSDTDSGNDITDGVGLTPGNFAMIYFNSKLHLIYAETTSQANTTYQVRAKAYDGTSWTAVDGGTGLKRTSGAKIGSNFSCSVYKGALYCNWSESSASTFNSSCSVIYKYDGKTWTNNDGGTSSTCPLTVGTIAADMSIVRQALVSSPNGNMYLFWDQTDAALNNGLRKYLRWYDGTTWSTDYTKYERTENTKTWYPEMMIQGSYLYTVWTEGANPSSTLHLARTLDGKTIEFVDGSSATADSGINKNIAHGASSPSMATLGPNLYIAWIEGKLTTSNNTTSTVGQMRVATYGPKSE